ncbi:hypothetical protein C900_03980 [Fulvivirga imtechensis AK7]|uniref:DUF4435 domain-containing protein n=1 Tax=Fulvivirga imtechensis AK7 TaxID=1237149 RepID=L8JNA3_9BACT|nr:DUF3226 domain-containing protein [Fulvivirga imtechensis]ELR70295.1 hypothetical protein C900_03980 [Fulvivirga imtechensis AK7]
MAELSFIVEGKSDKHFLKHFVQYHFGATIEDEDFIVVEGNIEKIHLVEQSIKSSSQAGKTNLLFFDADTDCYGTIDRIEEKRNEMSFEFDVFLFPNNHDSGNLETLLRGCINKDNDQLFECIDSYASCIDRLQLDNLQRFDEKAKFFVYVESFSVGGSGKGDKREYFEKQLWNLNSEGLKPLKEFLDIHLQ